MNSKVVYLLKSINEQDVKKTSKIKVNIGKNSKRFDSFIWSSAKVQQ